MFKFFRELNKTIQDLTAEVSLLRQAVLAKQPQPQEHKPSPDKPQTTTSMLNWLALRDPNYRGWKYKNLEQAILGACSRQSLSQISLLSVFQNQETTKVLDAIYKLKYLKLIARRQEGNKLYKATPLGIEALATIQELEINSKTK